jgi:hypothetical protein
VGNYLLSIAKDTIATTSHLFVVEVDRRRKLEGGLTNRLLILCFAVALAINVGYTLVGLGSIPAYYERVTTQTVEPYVIGGQTIVSNQQMETEAAERGMSLSAYAIYQSVLHCVLALVPLTVAAVVAWRARRQWFAWYTAFIIVFLGEYALAEQTYVARLIPFRWFEAGAIFWFLLLPYLYLFPNGKPVPRPGTAATTTTPNPAFKDALAWI